jgi:hypothetical protein
MAILVTGGAGYIGSVTVERLTAKGESIVVLDDLAYGHLESIDADIPFYQGSAGDRTLVTRIAREHEIESCMHFAALAYVGESVEEPALYFENNVQQGTSLSSVPSWTPAYVGLSFRPRALCTGSRRNRRSERTVHSGRKILMAGRSSLWNVFSKAMTLLTV